MIHNCVERRKPLNLRIEGAVAHVTVGNRTFQMDAEDLPLLEGWTLAITSRGYVQLQGTRNQTPRRFLYLSRAITSAPARCDVDHISGDTLDNRKANLRACTHSENMRNTSVRPTYANPYKGCYYGKNQRGDKKWVAQISIGGRPHYLGSFLTPEEAAAAYNAKAQEVCGTIARLNVLNAPRQKEAHHAT